MSIRPTLEIEAKITERGQITVPAAIRKMLGVDKGVVVFKGMPDGTVVIEPKLEEPEDDPVLAKFLEFLARDIENNPQKLVPLTQEMLDESYRLVGNIDIDLDAPLEDD